uniref:Uncharacterized protein n=1 Tax=Rhizophagus irregularis (strain DAOM 181602 / DAOM 197198 / MUCL 43194) TaxID=747089 RepID=U9SX28_RHIID
MHIKRARDFTYNALLFPRLFPAAFSWGCFKYDTARYMLRAVPQLSTNLVDVVSYCLPEDVFGQ